MKSRASHVYLHVMTALACIAIRNTSAQQIVPSLQWEHFYENSACDIVALSQTDDGGYILGGRIYTFTDEVRQNDCVIVKTDAQGAIEWQRSYGGSSNEAMRLVQQTQDKGFIFAASSTSLPSGNKEAPHFGLEDAWIVKVDALGNKQWERSFGGGGSDSAASVWQATDGGYILGGISPGLTGEANFWLAKIDPRGSTQWQRSFEEQISGGLVVQTADGGFVLAGGLSSPSVAQAPHFGGRDGWLMKIGEEGDKHWEHLFGGSEDDVFLFVDQSDDGGLILGGRSSSPPSGNKESPNHGGFDYWIVRVDSEGRKIWDRP